MKNSSIRLTSGLHKYIQKEKDDLSSRLADITKAKVIVLSETCPSDIKAAA
jgi:hypothetical protein